MIPFSLFLTNRPVSPFVLFFVVLFFEWLFENLHYVSYAVQIHCQASPPLPWYFKPQFHCMGNSGNKTKYSLPSLHYCCHSHHLGTSIKKYWSNTLLRLSFWTLLLQPEEEMRHFLWPLLNHFSNIPFSLVYSGFLEFSFLQRISVIFFLA